MCSVTATFRVYHGLGVCKLDQSVGTDLDDALAEITVDPRAKKIVRIDCYKHGASFRCQRCAVFCCKLGPPRLSQKDVKRLKLSGQSPNSYLDDNHINLRSREDGSCVLLSPDPRDMLHECIVYSFRPALCRVYPFQFQKLDEEKYQLEMITCCNGLNTPDGLPVDASFICRLVRSELFGLIDTNLI